MIIDITNPTIILYYIAKLSWNSFNAYKSGMFSMKLKGNTFQLTQLGMKKAII